MRTKLFDAIFIVICYQNKWFKLKKIKMCELKFKIK